jgi:hypothetical protein
MSRARGAIASGNDGNEYGSAVSLDAPLPVLHSQNRANRHRAKAIADPASKFRTLLTFWRERGDEGARLPCGATKEIGLPSA